jgi:hypothetical protein
MGWSFHGGHGIKDGADKIQVMADRCLAAKIELAQLYKKVHGTRNKSAVKEIATLVDEAFIASELVEPFDTDDDVSEFKCALPYPHDPRLCPTPPTP